MRVVIAPDSFKGSLSASEAAEAIELGLRRVMEDADIVRFAMADGGEGTLAMIASHDGVMARYINVPGADGREVRVPYCLVNLNGRACAVVESATIVGMQQGRACSVLDRSTRGIGRSLSRLLDQDLRSFVFALGASATNDGGAGLLAELGADFRDIQGRVIEPTPRGLIDCVRADLSGLDPRVAESTLLGLADVDSPLAGPNGATRIFGPQKGLKAHELELVDTALSRFGQLCDAARGTSFRSEPGSGAAGGLGFALRLLGGELVSGGAWLTQRYRLADVIAGADWVITGEGRSDAQTLHGKAPLQVAQLARDAGVRVSLISGTVDPDAWPQLGQIFHDYVALSQTADDTAALQEAAVRLERAAADWAMLRKQEKWSRDTPRHI